MSIADWLMLAGAVAGFALFVVIAAGKRMPPPPEDLKRAGQPDPVDIGEEGRQAITRFWRPQ